MTAIANTCSLPLTQQDEQVESHQQQTTCTTEDINKSSPTKTNKTKKPRTKVKYNSNGSSTTSFKLDKECVSATTAATTTTKKKRSPKSKITFVDESEAGNDSDQQKHEYQASALSSKPTSNFNAPRTVNKRLCKLRKQLKSCDHFTDNYFVIDLNNKAGAGQKASAPQVVSFKSPTEHFILHEEEDATHSEDDSSINSTDGSSDEKTNKRKRKDGNKSSKKQKQETTNTITQPECNHTFTPPELKPTDNIMATQLLNSLVDTMNTLSAELKKQDSSVVAHMLQQLLQQNGSELFKQMQQQIITQFQSEFQNLMNQAITQQMTQNQMFNNTYLPNNTIDHSMLATNDITPQDAMSTEQEFYELLNDTATTPSENSQYLSRWNHIDVRPTSPLTLEKPENQDVEKQTYLLEQGDCSFDSLFEH